MSNRKYSGVGIDVCSDQAEIEQRLKRFREEAASRAQGGPDRPVEKTKARPPARGW